MPESVIRTRAQRRAMQSSDEPSAKRAKTSGVSSSSSIPVRAQQVEVKATKGFPASGHIGFRHWMECDNGLEITHVPSKGWAAQFTNLASYIGWGIVKLNSNETRTLDAWDDAASQLKEGDTVWFTVEKVINAKRGKEFGLLDLPQEVLMTVDSFLEPRELCPFLFVDSRRINADTTDRFEEYRSNHLGMLVADDVVSDAVYNVPIDHCITFINQFVEACLNRFEAFFWYWRWKQEPEEAAVSDHVVELHEGKARERKLQNDLKDSISREEALRKENEQLKAQLAARK